MRGLVASSRVRRLRRLIPEDPTRSTTPAAQVRPLRVLTAALWLALITGPLEVALVLALKPLRDPTPGLFHMNRHLLWMIPLFHLTVFAVLGLLLGLLARLRPRLSSRRTAFVLLFVALFSLSLAVRGLHAIACLILAGGLAFRLAPRAESVLLGSNRVIKVSLPGLAVLFLGILALTIGREAGFEPRPHSGVHEAGSGAPNVLLIVMDTVGADHLGLWGYDRATTPHLERMARKGVRFEHARSTAPWTLPSHASMFTGLWPHELSAGFDGPLDSRPTTLAEFLRDRGYVTGGFIANTLYCSAETGLDRGFLHYEDHEISVAGIIHSAGLGQRVFEKTGSRAWRLAEGGARSVRRAISGREVAQPPVRPRKPYKDASRINRDALAWLASHPGRPFFLFLNLFDAHTPYLLPDACDQHFGLAPEGRADYATLNSFWGADKHKLSPRSIALAKDAYDDCIAYMDEQLGRLHDELDRRGMLRNTLIIITADHGEQFGAHDQFGHAGSLYRPEVHVPLLIIPPGGLPIGRTVPQPVSLRNIPATVADLIGHSGESPFPGSSLARRWEEPRIAEGQREHDDPVLSEVLSPATNNANQGRSPVFRGSMTSLVADGKVYIRNGDGTEELYDLESDAGESHNLAGNAEVLPLLSELRTRMARATGGESRPKR